MRKNYRQPSTTMSQQQKFAQVPSANIKRSRMDRSHGHKTAFGFQSNPGSARNGLIPVYVDEVLPGDSFHMKSTGFARLATPIHPLMDNLYMDIHYFFVPYRLVWDNWQRFMGERDDPNDDPNAYSIPQVDVPYTGGTQNLWYQLHYYMGLPMAAATGGSTSVSALPFRAYRLIWNEWYRDQNLQNSVTLPTDDGPDPTSYATTLLPRGKRKDYFTSALPWPQKGDPVHIPVELAGYVPVYGNPSDPDETVFTRGSVNPSEYDTALFKTQPGAAPRNFELYAAGEGQEGSSFLANLDGTWENVSNAATINDLRTAFQIQKLLERDARGGTRYTELIQSHFGVVSPDSRLQRPEYLGGDSSRITINPIAKTTDSDGTTAPQGNLAGYGTTVNQATFSKSFTEHGVVIGLASYRADLTYQRGIERMWNRQTRYDFFWPSLAHLGEQAILNKELGFNGDAADDSVFGYQERYAEYRYKPSRVTGIFNSDATDSIDVWHLAQDFDTGNVPLNEAFIWEVPPVDRTIAVPSEPYFIADFWFDLKCDRPMPIYAVPGMVDHF